MAEFDEVRERRRARVRIVSLALSLFVVGLLYRVLVTHQPLGRTGLMFVGIPVVLAALLALTPPAKTAEGRLVFGITLMLIIVAPLLGAIPAELPCRVIFVERDVEEVLDSQARMLVRRGKSIEMSAERRALLKAEYARTVARVKAMLARRAGTRVLSVGYRETVSNAGLVAARVNEFLGGGFDVGKMAAAVDAALHRNRA